ncbi:3-isopropylmalate dehydratase small subunit [Acidimicrobiia bacterium]|jgi:3-isopropylmalate/(R)-2-methylmalate dehydratase small subunit|nr:3-isopropylmalate dehydratase small subunit [bacterium]MDA7594740.1 3-isopropylmalate dehydratase small subunit [Acidimicrobiia bacterium]MDA7851046.1 3-isopropylmalate dehydratase small subunit [Acidimicrobiaceae bacterium]MDA8653128.1 3-isopropylmalate dehydratase small subunit [Candidatus Actinomarina sp.]MDA8710412.1 3-isopropylmalate dehydratase small subunit [Candidatus Actinomarina sp.]|tara:strand:- start:617 stop:1204 length:588 start_codon:yes stop_codon:yes gene_type:complete
MKKLKIIKSTMLPLNMSNVDTDQIMPKQFLKRVERSGYGEYLFYDWKKDPDFPLNNGLYKGAKVLVAGDNFGTGSSREHAPWGLQDWGFEAIISTKFADIFRLNSINIGLVPIETNQENVEALFSKIDTDSETIIQISIEDKTVVCGDISFSFSLDDFSQKRIVEGLDKIDITLGYLDQIENFSQSRKHWKPKLV